MSMTSILGTGKLPLQQQLPAANASVRRRSSSKHANANRQKFIQTRRRVSHRCKSGKVDSAGTEDTSLPLIYKRQDLSSQHAYEARQAFARCVARGEAGVNLAETALHISSEDDALVSHSSVLFPVKLYLDRVDKMVDELARLRLADVPAGSDPQKVLEVVDKYLYEEKKMRIPNSGRSNLPAAAKVAHPGVWEEARHAYLNEALTRRIASPACIAILYADIMQRLLERGAVDFAVRMECSSFDDLPKAVVLPGLTRATLLRKDGTLLNTCTLDALVEVLVHLKRTYWPFSWNSSYNEGDATKRPWSFGGFDAAATAAVEGMQSAEMEAISRTAAHRLSRGIWTSPGAGDLRRAKAAAERLCMLVGDSDLSERRDLAVLLVHSGEFERGKAELSAYMVSPAAASAPTETRLLVDRLDQLLDETLAAATEEPSAKISAEAASVVTIDSVLKQSPPSDEDEPLLDIPW